MNKKDLIKQNKLLAYFLKHISTVCVQHLNEIMMSGGEPEKISLTDFTATFNLHSFIDYFIITFGNELGLEGDVNISPEFKEKWAEHYKEHVDPMFKKGLELRKTIMGYGADDKGKGKAAEIYA